MGIYVWGVETNLNDLKLWVATTLRWGACDLSGIWSHLITRKRSASFKPPVGGSDKWDWKATYYVTTLKGHHFILVFLVWTLVLFFCYLWEPNSVWFMFLNMMRMKYLWNVYFFPLNDLVKSFKMSSWHSNRCDLQSYGRATLACPRPCQSSIL